MESRQAKKTFICPKCDAFHSRGFFMTPNVFRCLGCGYQGHGFHPDEQIDSEIAADIMDAQRFNITHGIPAGEFSP